MTSHDPHALAAAHGIGIVDAANFEHISGWAWNPDAPDESVLVEVLDGDRSLAVLRADRPRPDLQALGMGNGRHGFAIAYAPSLLPHARHVIRLRRLPDGVELLGSPRVLERPGGALDDGTKRHFEGLLAAEAELARRPADLDPALDFVAARMAQLLQRQLALATQATPPDLGELAGLLRSIPPARWLEAAGQATLATWAPLQLPSVEHPRVSIIVPVYGKFALTYACLQSILAHLPATSFELILVDDGSRDETLLAPLVFGSSVTVARNPVNLGFVGSCNRGAELARGEFLFFLNNDTLMRPGWLDELVHTFDTLPDVGVAGAKLVFEDGTLQEAGGIIWRMGDGWNWGRNADPDEPRFSYLRDADYVSGAALMIPRALFESLGGFDRHFAPAYYEDTDLCFRVRQAGRRVVVQPRSVVVHLEGQTAGTSVTGGGMKRFQAVNHRKFLERWNHVLADHRSNGQQPELECERGVRLRAVFIDESVPTPDQDAGSNAAVQHMRSLMRLGYKIIFIPADNMARTSPYTEALQALGIECLYHPYFSSAEEYFRKNTAPIDLVYLHRFNNASKYTGMVRRYQPDARIVYNVADLHHLRMEREALLTGDSALGARADAIRRQELAAIEAADATIVHSPVEQALIAQAAPDARVHVVPWTYAERRVAAPASRRHGVVFVGGYRHTPNVDAARWLVEEIMPKVWRHLPDLHCTLVGSHMPDEIRRLGSARVEVLGFVPDVAEVYERSLLAVAPLRYGAGIKGKVLEAFAAGVPCLMTSCAAEGVPLDAPLQRLVADSADALAELIVALHEQPDAVDTLADIGLALIRAHHSAATVDSALSVALAPSARPAPAPV